MKRHLLLIGICLLLPAMGKAQIEHLDSLKQLLPRQSGADRLHTLLNLAYQSFDVSLEDARQYAQDALAEARAIKNLPGEKHALTLMGEYYYNISDREKAMELLRQSDRIRISGDTEGYSGYNNIILANIFLEVPQKDSAQYYFQQAFALLEKTDNYRFKYYGYLCYAIFLRERYQLEEAKKILHDLYAEAVKHNARANQAEILIEFGSIAYAEDEFQIARIYLDKAKPLLPGPGYSYVLLIYFYHLGQTEYSLGNYYTAVTYLREVLSTKEIEQYDDIKAEVDALVGKIYVERGEFDLAMKSYLEAAGIFERIDMRQELGRVYGDLAWLYFKQFNDPETLNFVNKAIAIGTAIQDDFGVAHAHSVLGSLYVAQGRFADGFREHERALDFRKRIHSRSGMAESYYNLSTAYEKIGQIDQALLFANQSMALDEVLGNKYNLGLSNKKIAALYLLQGKFSLAKSHLLNAKSYAKQALSLELKRDVDLLFSEWYEKTGDLKMANQYLRTAINSNDSLYNAVNVEKTAEIRSLFDLENIELKSREREQELKLQRIELDSQRRYYLLVKIILLLVTILLVIGAFLYQASRKNNLKLLAEIAERKKAEEQNRISQLNLEEAQALAHIGSWEFNLIDSTFFWSKETYRIFEVESHPNEDLYKIWRRKCHLDDRGILQNAIKNTLTTGGSFHVEHRIVCDNGFIKYLSCIGEAVKDGSGKIVGLKGTDQDITLQKQAALAKSEFLSSMSHEIRTPINGVVGISNLLMEEKMTERQREYVHTLQFSAQHLSSIVSDILDFSKIESGNLVFEKLPFHLKEVASNVFKLFDSKAKEKRLRFDFLPDPRIDFPLSGDYVRLSQVLSNLLSNAIKFTEQGTVEFAYFLKGTTQTTSEVVFTIKDTGIGIESEQTTRIFDNFSQADVSISRKYGGTGLGLAISKRLVELQGGEITVESLPGKGSVFTVVLRYEKHLEKQIAEPGKAAPDADRHRLTGMKILVAEDNKVNVMVLTPLLRRWGAEYTVAYDGLEAIACVQQADFDAIIMDIQMPNVDGKAATYTIRQSADARKRDIPIIAFTADASVESRQDLLNSGFNDCLTKPFKLEQLFDTLKKYYVGGAGG